jgi:two-component sensor histidine kinase
LYEQEMTMDEDRVKGAARQVRGSIQEAAGRITGDRKTELEGKAAATAPSCAFQGDDKVCSMPDSRCGELDAHRQRVQLQMAGQTAQSAAPSSAESSLFLQEIHHRVCNSLQLVSSMLTLQAGQSKNAEVRHALGEAARRIVVVADVHRRLQTKDGGDLIDAVHYLRGLTAELQASIFDQTKGRSITCELPAALNLSSRDIGRVGLIVSELATNGLKYGEGRIHVRIRRAEHGLELIAEDEGKGFPAGFSPGESSGFGMRLIAALAMRGPASITVDPSVSFGRIVVQMAVDSDDPSP